MQGLLELFKLLVLIVLCVTVVPAAFSSSCNSFQVTAGFSLLLSLSLVKAAPVQ